MKNRNNSSADFRRDQRFRRQEKLRQEAARVKKEQEEREAFINSLREQIANRECEAVAQLVLKQMLEGPQQTKK